ncbi:MAG TPA: sigma-70 family RNA polymerase sigma factor [Polyangiaceae bacterium]|jgi:RNA polymerase sigma factor (sigma-70 family)|nr:sigma-70 family RNA polymerase sigma factor [Polyangiaceae bacterium]
MEPAGASFVVTFVEPPAANAALLFRHAWSAPASQKHAVEPRRTAPPVRAVETAKGPEPWFVTDMLRHVDALHNFARYLTSDPALAEDLVQEAFARCLAAHGRFVPGTNSKAWLFRILRNVFLDGCRRRKNDPAGRGLDAADASDDDVRDADPLRGDVEMDRLRGLVAGDIEAALEQLSADARMVVLMDLEGFTELLRTRLPRHSATDALKERLAASVGVVPEPRKRSARVVAWAAPLASFAAAASLALFLHGSAAHDAGASRAFVAETVNDHLRVLYAEHPVEIASGGIHQVKPWFAGRLDFAPVVAFDGDSEYVLDGGSVGYVVDRKAAAFHYRLGRHPITLFVFRADGLPWPDGTVPVGNHRAVSSSQRGFHVLMLRDGDLGYAMVSDASEPALLTLMSKVAGS